MNIKGKPETENRWLKIQFLRIKNDWDSGLVLDVKNPKDQNYLIFRKIDMEKSKILEHLILLFTKQKLKSE